MTLIPKLLMEIGPFLVTVLTFGTILIRVVLSVPLIASLSFGNFSTTVLTTARIRSPGIVPEQLCNCDGLDLSGLQLVFKNERQLPARLPIVVLQSCRLRLGAVRLGPDFTWLLGQRR